MPVITGAKAFYLGDKPVRVYKGSTLVYEPPPLPDPGAVTIEDIVYNQYGAPLRPDSKFPGWGAHELALGGVNASFDWYAGARPGPRPNDTTNRGFEGVDYTHHNVWGQVVPAQGGSPERRVRVQVELPRVYHLASGAKAWMQVRGTADDVKKFEGGYWAGSTFSKVTTMASGTHWRAETVGHSFDTAPMTNADGTPNGQSVGHWYYSGFYPRLRIPVGTQVAIYSRMRLITDVPGVNVEDAKFVGAFSGDLFTGETTNVGANGRNPPLAIPRHKLLTADWQPFSYVSGSQSDITSYPILPFLT